MEQKTDIIDFIMKISKDREKLDKLKKVRDPKELRDFMWDERIDEIPGFEECEKIVQAIYHFQDYIVQMAKMRPEDVRSY